MKEFAWISANIFAKPDKSATTLTGRLQSAAETFITKKHVHWQPGFFPEPNSGPKRLKLLTTATRAYWPLPSAQIFEDQVWALREITSANGHDFSWKMSQLQRGENGQSYASSCPLYFNLVRNLKHCSLLEILLKCVGQVKASSRPPKAYMLVQSTDYRVSFRLNIFRLSFTHRCPINIKCVVEVSLQWNRNCHDGHSLFSWCNDWLTDFWD